MSRQKIKITIRCSPSPPSPIGSGRLRGPAPPGGPGARRTLGEALGGAMAAGAGAVVGTSQGGIHGNSMGIPWEFHGDMVIDQNLTGFDGD